MHKNSLHISAARDSSCIKQVFRHWLYISFNDLDICEEEMTFPGCKPSLKKSDISDQVCLEMQPTLVENLEIQPI